MCEDFDIDAAFDSLIASGTSTESDAKLSRPARDEVDHMLARAKLADAPAGAGASASASGAHPALARVSKKLARETRKLAQVNILEGDGLAQYARDEEIVNDIGANTARFTRIVPTTFGLSGILSGVSFIESDLIKHVGPILRYPCIRADCNYGSAITPRFTEMVEQGLVSTRGLEKNARARAKKQERLGSKLRKVQGNGTCFNSSILFWVFSEEHQTVYKIRLFRTGNFGLPGTKPHMIQDIIRTLTQEFVPVLRDILRASAGRESPAPSIRLTFLAPIMKDYKWMRVIPRGSLLDLRAVDKRLTEQQSAANGCVPGVVVGYHSFSVRETKLAVKFMPVEGASAGCAEIAAPAKAVRVNLFRSGKINILGAHDVEFTKKICQLLANMLTDDIIARPGARSRARALK